MIFNFLSPKQQYKESDFSPNIISKVYEMCREYALFIDNCRRTYLADHPEIDPESDDYRYPIQYFKQEEFFPEGKLWHGSADWCEESYKVIHSVFLDITNDDSSYYSFSVEELSLTEFIMYKIERGTEDDD